MYHTVKKRKPVLERVGHSRQKTQIVCIVITIISWKEQRNSGSST